MHPNFSYNLNCTYTLNVSLFICHIDYDKFIGFKKYSKLFEFNAAPTNSLMLLYPDLFLMLFICVSTVL